MWGFAKLLGEDADASYIAYSIGRDESLDGTMVYDKKKKIISVKDFSASATERQSKYFAHIVGTAFLMGNVKNTATCIAS